jgi:Metallo-beta-lactamase superfamily
MPEAAAILFSLRLTADSEMEAVNATAFSAFIRSRATPGLVYDGQMRRRNLLLLMAVVALPARDTHSSCANCAAWNKPHQAFKIYGNTYYVGTHGLSSVLITSGTGHVLIDGALPESAPLIVANIRSLGFRIEDVKLIVNSHAHFDHAGGIAELQRLSGARVAASQWTADVMNKGAVARDDPQFGTLAPIARVARVESFKDSESLSAGAVTVTARSIFSIFSFFSFFSSSSPFLSPSLCPPRKRAVNETAKSFRLRLLLRKTIFANLLPRAEPSRLLRHQISLGGRSFSDCR